MSIDSDVPWSGPEPDDAEEWAKPEPLPLPPPRKPNILPTKGGGIFPWIAGIVVPPEPKCPRCGGKVNYRRDNESCWCPKCCRAFYHRSVHDLLTEAGIRFL